MFAVIKTGGKQYRVAAEDKLKVEKVAGEPGEIIQFGEVLVVGGDTVTLGTPTVSGASVAAEVVAQERGPKVIAFKKRRRKNSRRKRGSRHEFSMIRITEILTGGAKASKTAPPRPVRELRPKVEGQIEGPIEGQIEGKVEAKPRIKPAKSKAKKPAAKKPAKSAGKSKPAAKGKKK
jgi:large subunit ribosomal protein L21